MLLHRVQHGTKPVEGGFTWKYDRGLREAVRSGTWRDPIDLWPLWRDIACPILLVRGGDSDVLSAETAKRMLDENPNTRLAEVPGAGHTVPGDQPTAFRTLLDDFLA
jgi:pimeloyl-ACP methyl ester carboxylesterase